MQQRMYYSFRIVLLCKHYNQSLLYLYACMRSVHQQTRRSVIHLIKLFNLSLIHFYLIQPNYKDILDSSMIYETYYLLSNKNALNWFRPFQWKLIYCMKCISNYGSNMIGFPNIGKALLQNLTKKELPKKITFWITEKILGCVCHAPNSKRMKSWEALSLQGNWLWTEIEYPIVSNVDQCILRTVMT